MTTSVIPINQTIECALKAPRNHSQMISTFFSMIKSNNFVIALVTGVPSGLFGEISILFKFLSCWHSHRTEQIKYWISHYLYFPGIFIRIKPNIKYVSNGINNLRFPIEKTLRHEYVTEIHLLIEYLYHKAPQVAFLFYSEK